jgi:hypothetical protein
MSKLKFTQFNTQIQSGSSVVIIGRRAMGKTVLAKDLFKKIHNKLNIPTLAISGINNHKELKSLNTPNIIGTDNPIGVSTNITLNESALLILMDDCCHLKDIFKLPTINNLFLNGRHNKITFIITMSYAMDMPPMLRANTDLVFLFHDPIVSNKKRLYDQYAGMFPTFEAFCQVFDEITNDKYICMVIDNTCHSNKLEDMVFWYNAEIDN